MPVKSRPRRAPVMDLAKVIEICRFRGIPVLPTRPDKKAPFCPYRNYYDTGELPPESLFDEYPQATSAQAMMGQPFGFFAIDLDGPDAPGVWDGWITEHGGRPFRTWVTHSGGGGQHLWFRIPEWWGSRPLPKGDLWKGDAKHSAIERLGDHSLVMLPGSTHPETGGLYRFAAGSSPAEVPVPAVAPAWLMRLPLIQAPRVDRNPPPGWLSNLPDKIGVARAWGVRFTGRSRSGWHECHAIDRDDANPSAAVHEESGFYVDLGPSGERLTFVQLGARVGPFLSEDEVIKELKGGAF